MVISSLVLTLSPVPEQRSLALASLASDPRIEIGQAVRDRLPVVAEAPSVADGVALCEALAEQAGVVRVDVVAIDFGEDA